MEADKIIEGNKLIAEFMGFYTGEVSGWMHGKREGAYKKNEHGSIIEFYTYGQLKYHLSWEWLMPVVEKIKSKESDYPITTDDVLTIPIWKDIKTIWLAVVEFIDKYNTIEHLRHDTKKHP